jgi:hypothetical protein
MAKFEEFTIPRTSVNRGKNEEPDAARFTLDICVVRI